MPVSQPILLRIPCAPLTISLLIGTAQTMEIIKIFEKNGQRVELCQANVPIPKRSMLLNLQVVHRRIPYDVKARVCL